MSNAVPLAVIAALNLATGSNEWQGDDPPAELAAAAAAAILKLKAEIDRLQPINLADNSWDAP